jgi:hypothetical protein
LKVRRVLPYCIIYCSALLCFQGINVESIISNNKTPVLHPKQKDQTFGLKNKNKSAKVQALVQSVTRNVMNSGDQKEKKKQEDMKRLRANNKARKKAVIDERNALFGEALLAVKKKSTIKTKGGLTESKGRDADEPKAKAGQSRAMKMMFQMDAKEMEDALTADVSQYRSRNARQLGIVVVVVFFLPVLYLVFLVPYRYNISFGYL